MKILQIVGISILIILTSFYFFPFEFNFLPGINTKMAMAGVGLVLLPFNLAFQRNSIINKSFFLISLLAGLVSLIGFVSVVYNNTHDYTYATYIISMWVWVSAAYVLIQAIKRWHGYLSVELVCNYLIGVCVVQCVIAFLQNQFPPLRHYWDSLWLTADFSEKLDGRLYGIGATLDVAGTRFSAVLVIIACLLVRNMYSKVRIGLYLLSFLIIAVIGNMIARTTILGVAVALCYAIYLYRVSPQKNILKLKYVFGWLFGLLAVSVPVLIYLFQTSPSFQESFRFGFEGFFSIAEKGRWEVHSNEILSNMYVFPDNLKTWLIGDGYFNNPYGLDPYYTGFNWHGFYMQTDVGYLRFIYYFGLVGLAAFVAFMCKMGKDCMGRFSTYRSMFFMILLLNFIIWFKVSTDIFLVFALFICVNETKKKDEETMVIEEWTRL